MKFLYEKTMKIGEYGGIFIKIVIDRLVSLNLDFISLLKYIPCNADRCLVSSSAPDLITGNTIGCSYMYLILVKHELEGTTQQQNTPKVDLGTPITTHLLMLAAHMTCTFPSIFRKVL